MYRNYKQNLAQTSNRRLAMVVVALLLSFAALAGSGCGPAPAGEPPAGTSAVPNSTLAPTPSPEYSATPRAPLPPPPTLKPTSTPRPPDRLDVTLSPTATATDTPTATEEVPLRFAVIGDYGQAGDPEADVARLVNSWQPDLIITTGDNNYPSGSAETIDDNIGQYYSTYIAPYRGAYGNGASENRFFPSPGNHDWRARGLEPYVDYFNLPGNERYYDFVRGPVHFFSVDSDSSEPDGVHDDSVQAQWLKAAMAASTEPWNIVYMHQPPYSSGYHGPVKWMRWPFQAWGADAVLAGHDHTYERLLVDGLVYFVNGLGGNAARYRFDDIEDGSQVRFNDDYGAMLVEATSGAITFQFVTRSGQIVDVYSLNASP